MAAPRKFSEKDFEDQTERIEDLKKELRRATLDAKENTAKNWSRLGQALISLQTEEARLVAMQVGRENIKVDLYVLPNPDALVCFKKAAEIGDSLDAYRYANLLFNQIKQADLSIERKTELANEIYEVMEKAIPNYKPTAGTYDFSKDLNLLMVNLCKYMATETKKEKREEKRETKEEKRIEEKATDSWEKKEVPYTKKIAELEATKAQKSAAKADELGSKPRGHIAKNPTKPPADTSFNLNEIKKSLMAVKGKLDTEIWTKTIIDDNGEAWINPSFNDKVKKRDFLNDLIDTLINLQIQKTAPTTLDEFKTLVFNLAEQPQYDMQTVLAGVRSKRTKDVLKKALGIYGDEFVNTFKNKAEVIAERKTPKP